MTTFSETSYKKATQALNLLAEKKGGEINKMKAIKLIYLADRLHLRKYGRPIIDDVYWAMKLGPVGSRVKNVAELSTDLPKETSSYAKKYVKAIDEKKSVMSVSKPDLDLFSKTDLECLEQVYKTFSDKDQFELARLTHDYPEWFKHKRQLDSGKKRVRMNYDDFFNNISDNTSDDYDIFLQDKKGLLLAKECFDETRVVIDFFAR